MARLIIENLTEEQAEALADWFEGQGEQDCCSWLEESGVKSPLTDVQREGGFMEKMPNGDVVVYTITH